MNRPTECQPCYYSSALLLNLNPTCLRTKSPVKNTQTVSQIIIFIKVHKQLKEERKYKDWKM